MARTERWNRAEVDLGDYPVDLSAPRRIEFRSRGGSADYEITDEVRDAFETSGKLFFRVTAVASENRVVSEDFLDDGVGETSTGSGERYPPKIVVHWRDADLADPLALPDG